MTQLTHFSIKLSTTNNRAASRQVARVRLVAAAALAVASLFSANVLAAGGVKVAKVTRGSATVETSGSNTVIRASDRTVINFRQFDVAKGSRVQFIQPGEMSRVLSRITGGTPSRIDGSITANGQLYFVNPAGIVFGRDAHVKANSFVAAAANLSDMNFVRGIDAFTGGTGTVSNAGAIEADFAALIGGRVANTGTITSPDGIVAMISGDEVTLGRRGDTVSVKVTGGTPGELPGTSNAGTIKAGRHVVIGAGDLYSLAVQNRGTITAPNVTLQATAGNGAIVDVGGTIDASSSTGVGGRVEVLGDYVALQGATIDASGRDGGGTVLVGGDWQGSGTTPPARQVFVNEESSINVNAVEAGDGGNVVLWSTGRTVFNGKITAIGRGGYQGGKVETSGGSVAISGSAVTAAKSCDGGSWLIDPTNIEIRKQTASTDDFNEMGGVSGVFDVSLSDKGTTILSVDRLLQALRDNKTVMLQTGHDDNVDPQKLYYNQNDRPPLVGQITVFDPIVYTGAKKRTLVFEADANISLRAPIQATNGKLNIEMYAAQAFRIGASRTTFKEVADGVTAGIQLGADYGSPNSRSVFVDTNGGDFTAAAVSVQSYFNDRNPTDKGKFAYFGQLYFDTPISTASRSGSVGGNVVIDAGGGIEIGDVRTGNGNITLHGATTPISDFDADRKQIIYQHRQTSLDAGTGEVSMSARTIFLTGDAIRGGKVELRASGKKQIGSSGVVLVGDQLSELLFDLGREGGSTLNGQILTPRRHQQQVIGTLNGPVYEVNTLEKKENGTIGGKRNLLPDEDARKVLAELKGRIVAPVNGISEKPNGLTDGFFAIEFGRQDPNDPTLVTPVKLVEISQANLQPVPAPSRNYEIVGDKRGVSILSSLQGLRSYNLAIKAGTGPAKIVGSVTGPIDLTINAGSIQTQGPIGIVAPPAKIVGNIATAPLASISLSAQQIRVNSLVAGTDVVPGATGTIAVTATDGIIFDGKNPLIATDAANGLQFNQVPSVKTGSKQPIVAGKDFGADAFGTLYKGDIRDIDFVPVETPPRPIRPTFLNQELDELNPNSYSAAVGVTASSTARSAANEIAGATPQTSRTTEVARSIPTNLAAELKQVGVTVRPITADELIATLGGRALYNDTSAQPPYIQIGATNLSGRVADPRISSRLAAEVVSQYNLTVKRPARDDQGRVAVRPDGSVPLVDHVDQLKANLAAAINDYSTAHPGAIDPVALRAFIDQTPAYGEAKADLANLQELFRLVDLVGLTPSEAANSRKQVTRPLLPPDTELDLPTFEATILNRPLPGTPTTAQ